MTTLMLSMKCQESRYVVGIRLGTPGSPGVHTTCQPNTGPGAWFSRTNPAEDSGGKWSCWPTVPREPRLLHTGPTPAVPSDQVGPQLRNAPQTIGCALRLQNTRGSPRLPENSEKLRSSETAWPRTLPPRGQRDRPDKEGYSGTDSTNLRGQKCWGPAAGGKHSHTWAGAVRVRMF